ncbi:MAG: hypothetical protein ACLRP3_10945 [Escherichia sp.]
MLISLIGTPWMPKIENGILVRKILTTLSASTYAVTLYHAGILPRQRRLFSVALAAYANDYDAGYNLGRVRVFAFPPVDSTHYRPRFWS